MRARLHLLLARIRGLLRPGSVDADFDEEMAAHLAAAEEDGVRRGLTPDEARRLARVQLGGVAQLREASRAAQGLPWLGSCWLDLRLGVRLLVKHPGLTLVSTLALATGVAIVAGFHAGTEFMVRPELPDARGEEVVALWNHDVARSDRGEQTLGDMLAWRALHQQLSQEPDVRGVTFDAFLGVRPFEAGSSAASVASWTNIVAIAPDYFDVQQTPIIAGRAFDEAADGRVARPMAIVNEAFVRTSLATGVAVGQRVRPFDAGNGRSQETPLEIVGVVRDVLTFEISQRGPRWVAQPTIYVPLTTTPPTLRMILHVRGAPEAFVPRLRAVAARIDPTLVVYQPMPLEPLYRIDRIFLRLYEFVVGFVVFALVLLSTAGVYSMMSFLVAQRTREVGIRIALGARPTRVVADVFARALWLLCAGTSVGLGVGFAAANGPFALSDGVFQHGPGLMMGIAGLIVATGVIACGIPLRRALRIQPVEALRAEV